jgi:acyl transferase domain-containing protein/3-hydroxymyristoyl/3-hydroxydecanoyl-(acyl carrier protein) dehydratase
MKVAHPVAIVGIGVVFPAPLDRCRSQAAFWELLVSGESAISEAGSENWLFDPAPAQGGLHAPDDSASTRAAARLPDFPPKWNEIEVRVPWLSLQDKSVRIACSAAHDALMEVRSALPPAHRRALFLGQIALPTSRLVRAVQDAFDGVSADALAEGPNARSVLAGPLQAIVEIFGIDGAHHSIDAACASSLFALHNAMSALASGDADFVLAGGLGAPDNLYVHLGFTQLGALSTSGRCRPLTDEADGLIPGEGCALFALKRLDDALRDGDAVHAVLRSASLTNDQAGPILLPQREGQVRALRENYDALSTTSLDVDLVICHATGTPTGDRIEVEALAECIDTRSTEPIWLRAPKANVGHWLTGAGAAGVLEAILSMRHRTIAPQPGAKRALVEVQTHPHFALASHPVAFPEHADRPQRVAVSGFGFGGTNAHVVIEAFDPARMPGSSAANQGVSRTVVAVAAEQSQDWTDASGAVHLPWRINGIAPRDLQNALLHQSEVMAAVLLLNGPSGRIERNRVLGEGGIFLGTELDARTVRFHLRWRDLKEGGDANHPSVSPALDADRTLGGLVSVAASRVARAMQLGGPAYVLGHASDPGRAALEEAYHAIRRGQLEWAIVVQSHAHGDEFSPAAHADHGAKAMLLVEASLAQRQNLPILQVLPDAETPVPDFSQAFAATRIVRPIDGGWRQFLLQAPSREGLDLALSELCSQAERGDDLDALAWRWLQRRRTTTPAAWRFALATSSSSGILDAVASFRASAATGIKSVHRQEWRATFGQSRARGPLCFMYPGSASWLPDMGRALVEEIPAAGNLVRGTGIANVHELLATHVTWTRGEHAPDRGRHIADWMAAQVGYGAMVVNLLAQLGVDADAAFGVSLGESTALVAHRVWATPAQIFTNVKHHPLFRSWLCDGHSIARAHFHTEADDSSWLSVSVAAAASEVRQALVGQQNVAAMLILTPNMVVIGGEPQAVRALCEAHRWTIRPILGAPSVHVPWIVDGEVAKAYRDMHDLACNEPSPSIRIYSPGHGGVLVPHHSVIADALLAQARSCVDVPAMFAQTERDGMGYYLDIGPDASMSWQAKECLADSDEQAVVVTVARHGGARMRDIVGAAMELWAQGRDVDLLRFDAFTTQSWQPRPPEESFVVLDHQLAPKKHAEVATEAPISNKHNVQQPLSWIEACASLHQIHAQTHETFLRVQSLAQNMALSLAQAPTLARQPALKRPLQAFAQETGSQTTPRPTLFLDRHGCMGLAIGRLGETLGQQFAAVDALPSRVRLPDEPLMLVDRILAVKGEPLVLGSGEVVTEHDVLENGWYLDGGRIPTCVAVEAGQADLFLSGYLGIDLVTQGLAFYRLLDAVVTFHGELPGPGEVIHYEIHIDEFFELDHTWFFRFWFDATVGGRSLMSMRSGCAGFFTPKALESGKGLVAYPLRIRQAQPRENTARFVRSDVRSISEAALDALRAGDLVEAFGESHRGLACKRPLTIPGGKMRLVHRITQVDAEGGAFGLGKIIGEADVDPQAWYLTCHFVDDRVMPGTLMYECCLHTLRVLLMHYGWIGESGENTWQPVLECASRLKCRGQVLETTKVITYEVHIQEIVAGDEPGVIAFARMYADGKAIVEIEDMSVRLRHASHDRIRAQWQDAATSRNIWLQHAPKARPALYSRQQILAFSTGLPSQAFGPTYRVFDEQRAIARLPRPPFQFLDRVVAVHGEPFVMKAGAACESEFDFDPTHWSLYVQQEATLPFAVLLEIALQPCGWLAAYVGSALVTDEDLRFRNLGGSGTILQRYPDPDLGGLERGCADILAVAVKLRDVSHSGGMIVQHFDFEVRSRGLDAVIYSGVTTFGFFSANALANQIGIRSAKWRGDDFRVPESLAASALPRGPSWPVDRYRMIDAIETLTLHDGPENLGYAQAAIAVDGHAWFFNAHFWGDPVWPGSLGLEAFVQLVTLWMRQRYGADDAHVEAPRGREKHAWMYRGQIIPRDKEVRVEAWPTQQIDAATWRFSGQLAVDGRIIYRMDDFVARLNLGGLT